MLFTRIFFSSPVGFQCVSVSCEIAGNSIYSMQTLGKHRAYTSESANKPSTLTVSDESLSQCKPREFLKNEYVPLVRVVVGLAAKNSVIFRDAPPEAVIILFVCTRL